MDLLISRIRLFVVVGTLAAVATAPVQAELTRVEIASRVDVLDGKAWGEVGPYEKIQGKAYFAVDPANPRNQVIADIALAPRNKAGKVEFSADLFILEPKDSSRGNGVVFFDVVNRGRFRLLSVFSDAEGADDPTTEAHFGDASLLLQGCTLVAVGWQFDVADALIGLQAPKATQAGRPIKGWVREWFIPTKASDSYEWTSGDTTKGYLPADPEATHHRLTAREGLFAARRLIARGDWSFGKIVDGKLVPDPKFVTLKGGFRPGLTYEVAFESQDPPVAGLGLAAIRDMASAMKYDPRSVAPGRYAYMYGSSQTGRTLRQILYEGFTIDEKGRKVFDAAFVRTGGASMGRFNERFALSNSLGVFLETQFPFQYQTTTVPAADGGGQFKNNTLNYEWLPRGLLPALDAWVRNGTEPPPSRHPRFSDGTMVAHQDLQFPAVPGVRWPTHVPGGYRWDVAAPLSALPFLLSKVDADGNEIGGIRLPEQAVPLATLTGWQFRSERIGAPQTLITNGGAYIPFPATRAERDQTGDPRLSIEERYSGRAEYLAKAEQVAKRLAEERYILAGDVAAIVAEAGKHWDWRTTPGK